MNKKHGSNALHALKFITIIVMSGGRWKELLFGLTIIIAVEVCMGRER